MKNKTIFKTGVSCIFRPLAAGALALSFNCFSANAGEMDASVLLSEAHLRYHDREIMALIHWGPNTYTGQEWGFGNVSPSVVKANRLDPVQWVEAAKAAEIKSIVLVAKHHDGFCLWPAKNNLSYSMAAVPSPNTGRDLVRETAEACKAAGLLFGVYLSPWDRHQASYGKPEYVEYFFDQWRDVLDNYGDICEIWLDGANGGTGWYGGANGGKGERRSIPAGYYKKDELLKILREKHPLAVAFGGGGENSTGWCGNERGFSPEIWWNPRKRGDGKSFWIPSEADFPLRGGWVYHANQKPKSLAYLVKAYFETVGRGAVMNIGIAPDKEGRVCAADAKRLAEFGEWVRDFNSIDLAKGAKQIERRDGNVLVIDLEFGAPVEFNCIDIKERIAEGQRIKAFSVEVPDAIGLWRTIAKGTTVGHRRLARTPVVKTNRVRMTLDGIAPPQMLPVALRMAKGVKDDEGEFGNIEANTVKQRITFDKPVKARYFKFTATHSIGANEQAALAEIDIW